MQAFVPKNRRPKFELVLKIIDLNNVPLVSGTSCIKWHLPSSNSAEHRGRTLKSIIKDHKVSWDYEKTLPVRLIVDRNGMLQESEIHFEVLQEYSSGARGERIVLGVLKLNLAEYVEGADDGEDGIVRRYLMQESKVNSTVKICISMKQIEGDRNFIVPPLKTAPVFGGIAGIISAEGEKPDDPAHMPSMSSKTRELGELQDMYRRTLAASWTAHPDELPADECIENIFAGGDGWAHSGRPSTASTVRGGKEERAHAEGEKRKLWGRRRRRSEDKRSHERKSSGEDVPRRMGAVSGRESIEHQVQSTNAKAKGQEYAGAQELDEFEEREDLRSWEISAQG